MRIALDAMGGDHAPEAICEGIRLAAQEWRDDEFVLIGPEAKVQPLFRRRASVQPTDSSIRRNGLDRMRNRSRRSGGKKKPPWRSAANW